MSKTLTRLFYTHDIQNDDPWKDVGSGRRLDGKPKINGNTNTKQQRPIHELSEEEQLQAAIRASMMDSNDDNNTKQLSSNDSFLQEILSMDVKEPTNGNGARVQIRMPGGGNKLVKKFDGEDPVKVIYAFVAVSHNNVSFVLQT